MTSTTTPTVPSPVLRLLKYANRYRRRYLWSSFCSVTNKLFDIAPEILIGVAIDVVVQQQNSFLARLGFVDTTHQLIFLAVLTFFIWGFESIFEYLYSLGWRGLAQTIQHDLRTDTYERVQNMDVSYFEDQSSGNLVAIMNDDINQLERFLDGGANDLIQVATTVLAVGSIFFIIAPQVAIWAMLPIPVIVISAFYYERKAQPLYADVRLKAGKIAARLTNNITGLLTIKAHTAEDHEKTALQRESLGYLNANARAIKVSSAFIPIIRMAILAGFLATLVIGGRLTLAGDLSIGAYGVLVFLTQRLLWPLTGLAQTIDLYQRAMASTRRILDLLETPPQAPSGHRKLLDSEATGVIEFRNVNFAYPARNATLTDITFKVTAGQTVALVGATGSGKSTIAKLLLRFYEPSSGSIFFDGYDMREIEPLSLRRLIGFVGQDHFLVSATLKENIIYGSWHIFSPSEKESAIAKAANLADVSSFASGLPHGFATVVGERGQKLSGGQRQRVALARAIIKNPKVLLLDEATSAVDNETEQLIQRSLKKLAMGRTTIMIAHRLSTIKHADQIHVLDDGKIVESGRHDELLASDGHYARLWRIQTGQSIKSS